MQTHLNKFRILPFFLGVVLFSLTQCDVVTEESLDVEDRLYLSPVDFGQLEGWDDHEMTQAADAFAKTCAVYLKRATGKKMGYAGVAKDWHPVCRVFQKENPNNTLELKDFFKTHFQPYQIKNNTAHSGTFTGYYEPELRGSLTPSAQYHYPLYRTPSDLVVIHDLGAFRPHLKGERIAGKLSKGKLVPYHDRRTIDQGALKNKAYEIVWVDSPIDAFFLHIQGSGRVRLPDGGILRVGYDAQNGHMYDAIGKFLIASGEVAKEDMSMQRIKTWLKENPAQAKDLMHQNKSYIFFKKLETEAPIGSFGVPLTELRSLAVDRRHHPQGIPMWVDTTHPVDEEQRWNGLLFAQDTGGAIKGPVRGDIFWGAGAIAELYSGKMNRQGKLYVFLPKNIKVPEKYFGS